MGRRGDKSSDAVWNHLYAPFRRGRRGNNQANNRQEMLEIMYRRILGELAMNRFEWKGFENTGVDVRYLELQLYYHALSVVFKDTTKIDKHGAITHVGTDQIYALKAAASGTRNLVDNPTAFTLTGTTFTGHQRMATECVPIWANYFRVPDLDIVNIYASKFAELDRTIEINSLNARRSKVLVYNENTKLTAQNINDMIDRGEGSIPINFQLGDMVQSLDMGIDPRTLEPLSVLKSRLWNECMGLLGINNANHDKKERVQAAEVESNNDQVGSARRMNLNARQDAAAQINKMFNMNVSVDYYTSTPVETVNPMTNEQTSGGGASA